MVVASGSYVAGEVIGALILIVIAVGLIRTFFRHDLTWREKVFGKSRRRNR